MTGVLLTNFRGMQDQSLRSGSRDAFCWLAMEKVIFHFLKKSGDDAFQPNIIITIVIYLKNFRIAKF